MKYTSSQNVIELNKAKPELALERLNRLTGLNFSSLPQSLVNPQKNQQQNTDECEYNILLRAKF